MGSDDVPFNGSTLSTLCTSLASAQHLRSVAGTLKAEVLAFIHRCGPLGATCDEAELALSMKHQTCSARIRDLSREGLIHDSGSTRLTRSGRKAVVYFA